MGLSDTQKTNKLSVDCRQKQYVLQSIYLWLPSNDVIVLLSDHTAQRLGCRMSNNVSYRMIIVRKKVCNVINVYRLLASY